MSDLIRDLEAATEGSRKLDVMIAAELSPRSESVTSFGERSANIPYFTTSLDAARTLVPEEAAVTLEFGDGQAFASIAIALGNTPTGTAPTPALALCIAALTAQEAPPE